MKVTMPDYGAAHVIGTKCKETDINEVTVYLSNDYDPNLVYITGFGANPVQCGYGTKAMKFICDLADEYNYALILKPCRSNRKVLNKFYPRFDFRYINDAEMLRNSATAREKEKQV